MKRKNYISKILSLSLLFLTASCGAEEADKVEVLNVYNCADYIAEDDPETGEKGLLSRFEDYMRSKGRNVRINYSCYDTNETMLSELKTGKAQYDLICPSDYIIQKLMAEDMIIPFDEGSTPDYDKNVSPFVYDKLDKITVEYEGETRRVSQYAKGYMWGTLAILYNNTYRGLSSEIDPKEMDQDMRDWNSLWEPKYRNLLAIKDSVRDTYAAGIFKAFNEELKECKAVYDSSEKTQTDKDVYNAKVSEIFNRCDDQTIRTVEKELKSLKANAFGFEVDSGKIDMARGMNFAINIAWSGDAAWAMDMADENNEANASNPSFKPTKLKYTIPDTGANIWFDGWCMPKGANKELAQEFVNFLSISENAAMNMEAIGYTPVIAGDEVLSLVQSYYDLRYDEETEAIDPSVLEDYTEVTVSEIPDLTEEEMQSSYYTKNISYFFDGTLEELTEEDCLFAIAAGDMGTQFDTQYPDEVDLPRLAVMADFGAQNANILLMWENMKNSPLPVWSYYVILVSVLLLIGSYTGYKLYKLKVKKDRIARHKKARANAK